MPDTIHALLAARIDSLPADEKRLIQDAAVVGRVFWPGALSHADGGEVIDALRRVERRGLIAVRPSSTIENEPEYMFRHVLIRDVAYASVPKRRRARAHAETGRWIEGLADDRIDEFAELIAFHYAAAVIDTDADLAWNDDPAERDAVRRRAFEMLIRAGSTARRRFAVDKALELHAQALEVASTDSERLPRTRTWATTTRPCSMATTRFGSTSPRPSSMVSTDQQRGQLAAKAGRMVMRWGAFQKTPPIDQVEALVGDALQSDVSERTRASLLMVHGGLLRSSRGVPIAAGRIPARHELVGDIDTRIASIEQGLEIARRLDDIDLLHLGTDVLTVAFQAAGDYDNARDAAEQQAALLGRLTSVRDQVDTLVTVAASRTDRGAYAAAIEAAEEGFARSAGLSGHERMHVAYEIVAAAEPSGNWQRIADLLPWFASAADAEGDITCASVRAGPPFGATVLARRGDTATALEPVPLRDMRDAPGTFVAAAHLANYASLVTRPIRRAT